MEKEAKKKQKIAEIKEIRITPNIEEHDFGFKAKNARKFIEDGNKVKITVRFRGREVNYVKMGEDVLKQLKRTSKYYGAFIGENKNYSDEINKYL